MLAITLLFLGILSRLIIHVPNFTPVIAIALFGGVYLSSRQALWLPLLLLAVTDILIGFHNTMPYTWSSIFFISLTGLWLKKHKSSKTIFISSVWSSILFFVVTNFGVWLSGGLYPLTFVGLRDCFILAIPFFKYELLATCLYTVLFFGLYEVIAVRAKHTRFAHVL